MKEVASSAYSLMEFITYQVVPKQTSVNYSHSLYYRKSQTKHKILFIHFVSESDLGAPLSLCLELMGFHEGRGRPPSNKEL